LAREILSWRARVPMMRIFTPLGLDAHVEYKSEYGKGEPTDVMIDALIADYKASGCDRIIAIGGGGVIDMAKILVLEGEHTAEQVYRRQVPLKKAHTLIAVPTTCGAGSEVSNVSIAELTSIHSKMGLADDSIFADEAVLVPELLTKLPYSFFATSAIDAFIHAIESYVSPKATLYTRMFRQPGNGNDPGWIPEDCGAWTGISHGDSGSVLDSK